MSDIQSHAESGVYKQQGFGTPLPVKGNIGLLIVDFVVGFADPKTFGGGNIAPAIERTTHLLAAARRNKWPVAHSRIVYAADGSDDNVFSLKVPGMATLTEEGAVIAEETYRAALALRDRLRAGFHAFLGGCDAIVTIPAAGAAPHGLTYTGDASFCACWSFLGVPAVTVPSGLTAEGLPLGLQIVGDVDDDLPMLQTAAWIENTVG